MAGSMFFTFCVSLAALLALASALYRLELDGKRLDVTPEAAAGGSRMSSGEKYVAAAYLVVFAVVLVYLVIMSLKLQRLQRELAELAELARERREREHEPVSREAAEVG